MPLISIRLISSRLKCIPAVGGCNGAFIFGIYRLVPFFIFFVGLTLDVFGQGRFTHTVQYGFEFGFCTVKRETYGTAAKSYYRLLCYQLIIIAEVQFDTHPDFTGRINDHIPKPVLLCSARAAGITSIRAPVFSLRPTGGRKNFRSYLHDYHIFVIKVIHDVLKHFVLDLTGIRCTTIRRLSSRCLEGCWAIRLIRRSNLNWDNFISYRI